MTESAPTSRASPPALQPSAFGWALRRDLSLAMRQRSDLLNLIGFFVLACAMFPLAVGPHGEILRRIGGGVVWVAALLSTMIATPRLFDQDWRDGSLDQMIASGRSLWSIVMGKLLAAWLTGPFPLVLIAPLLAMTFRLDGAESLWLTASLLVGTPTLQAIAMLAAALTLGLRGASTLVTLLCLPLFAPVLIFGAGTVDRWQAGLDPTGPLALLGAGMLATLVVAPFLTAMSLRIALE